MQHTIVNLSLTIIMSTHRDNEMTQFIKFLLIWHLVLLMMEIFIIFKYNGSYIRQHNAHVYA